MRALVIANGTPPEPGLVHRLARDADLVVCADGGALAALAAGLRPHWIVGDLDSLTEGMIAGWLPLGTGIRRYPARKDETDLELALLHVLQCGADEITIVGALGGRVDQTLANLFLLAMPALRGVRTRIRDEYCEVQLIDGEGTIRGQVGDTVSLLPLGGDAVGIETEGLEWALEGGTLTLGGARGVSNVLTAPVAAVRLRSGLLLSVRLLT